MEKKEQYLWDIVISAWVTQMRIKKQANLKKCVVVLNVVDQVRFEI